MKESRFIIIVFTLISVLLIPIFIFGPRMIPIEIDYLSIATGLYCSLIVAIVTGLCSYFINKQQIISRVYNSYFSFYRSYYNAKNRPSLFRYNALYVYKNIIEMSPKIDEALDEYYGFFKKYDKTYKKLNPNMELYDNFKAKTVIKSVFAIFNKKSFDKVFEPLVNQVESILINIDKNRFQKDKEHMIKMFNYIWDIKK